MIRTLQSEDIEKVAEIWLDTNTKAHNFILAQYWQSNFELVKEMFEQAEIYVYEYGNKILGFIGLNEEYIEGIFVSEEAQSQGIGKRLLDFVKERKKSLRLSVYKKNKRAINFYQREKFIIENESLDEDTGEKEYTMIWEGR